MNIKFLLLGLWMAQGIGSTSAKNFHSASSQPTAEPTAQVIIADEKLGDWWGYNQKGRVTICTRAGIDELSSSWIERCKDKGRGVPALFEILDYQASFGSHGPGLMWAVD